MQPIEKEYSEKAQAFLTSSALPALTKLRNLDPLTKAEKNELETIFFSQLGSYQEFCAWSKGTELLPFLRKQLGISEDAILSKFGYFLNSEQLSPEQLICCHQIIDYARRHGDIRITTLLTDPSFTVIDWADILKTNAHYFKELINGFHKPIM